MDQAKTLLRTTVRTFFTNPKQILIIDALLLHSVLHIDDLAILLTSQAKDIRALINPLRTARLLSTHSRLEVRVGSNRGSPREYYYIPYHPAIDAIKYRIAKLRRKVEALYQQDETKRKDWRCPRCKAEYEELEILDKIGDEGFYCDRCSSTLVQNEAAAQERGSHEKIRTLNIQLAPFDEMIAKIDRVEVPENDFQSAWDRRKEVPREKGTGYASKAEWIEVGSDKNKARTMAKKQETVDSKNLNVSLLDSADREREMEEERERRKAELAKQNAMPVWHSKSAIGLGAENAVKSEEGGSDVASSGSAIKGEPVKKEDYNADEKKPNVEEDKMQDEVAAYMAEMERERVERERKEQEESDEEDDEGDFEDVGVGVGTPASRSQASNGNNGNIPRNGMKQESFNGKQTVNGLKRELDDGGSSGLSSEANTPLPFSSSAANMGERDAKKVKFENGSSSSSGKINSNNNNVYRPTNSANHINSNSTNNGSHVKKEEDADSDEDEDFEDAM